MSAKSLLLTAGVALAVIVAHDKIKSGQITMPKTVR